MAASEGVGVSGVLGYAQLLAAPLAVLVVIALVAWRQERRRPATRRRATGLRKVRWGHGSASRTFGQPESGGPRSSGTGPGQGPYDRPTHLD